MESDDEGHASALPMNKLAKAYLRIRAAMQEEEREHDTRMEALKATREEIAMAMKDQMRAVGADSVKTDSGTVMLTKKTRYYATDWEEMKKFIMEHDAIDLLEKRISQVNMRQFLEVNPDKAPPGLNSVQEFEISVRKPTK